MKQTSAQKQMDVNSIHISSGAILFPAKRHALVLPSLWPALLQSLPSGSIGPKFREFSTVFLYEE